MGQEHSSGGPEGEFPWDAHEPGRRRFSQAQQLTDSSEIGCLKVGRTNFIVTLCLDTFMFGICYIMALITGSEANRKMNTRLYPQTTFAALSGKTHIRANWINNGSIPSA